MVFLQLRKFFSLMLLLMLASFSVHSQSLSQQEIEYLNTDEGKKILESLYKKNKMMSNPLPPEEVKGLMMDEIKVQQARMVNGNVTKTIKRSVSISPGTSQKTEKIKLAPGFPTSLVFLDSSGKPFVIEKFISGNEEWFLDEKVSDHIVTVTPKVVAAKTNAHILLKGQTTLLTITLSVADITNQKVTIDDLVELRMPFRSPDSELEVVNYSFPGEDNKENGVLYAFLDNASGEILDAEPLVFSDEAESLISGWEYKGNYYFRTKSAVSWPAYDRIVKSGEALPTYVYRTPKDIVVRIKTLMGDEMVLDILNN